jgi:small subunit ribosomal protein S6
LRFYETTIVLDPQTEDAVIEREVEKVTNTIVRAEGQLVTTQKWGVKRLAYAIQKHAQAHYVHFVYQAPPSVPGELESMFRINETILRHLTVLVEGPLPKARTAETHGETDAVAPGPAEPAPAPAPAAVPAPATTTESSTDAPVAVAEKPDDKS